MRGYLLPEGNFDHRSTTQKFISPKKVIFGTETDNTVENNVGRAGQFIEDLTSETTSLGASAVSDTLGISLTNPLIFSSGTGVTLSNDGAEYDGGSRLEQQISIGQVVETTSDVIFNQVSASSISIGDFSMTGTTMTGDLNVTGSVTTTGALTVNGAATITGILTAQEFHTEVVSASIIYSSGSTQFGNDTSDTHEFTGSLLITGSLSMNNYSVTEISNDTTLADSNAEALVTENAAKTYIDNQTDDQQAYLRKQFVKLSSSITIPGTASFSATSASAPTGMTTTSENDFIFFINGQYMEHDAIQIQQESSTFRLIVDNDSIGYDLESDDEILAIGKFNS
jgi:ethanolamine utilization microcompartment shell protein EutS